MITIFLKIKKVFQWLNSKKISISSWMTILGFPLIIIGGLLAYFQLSDYLIRADLRLEFLHPESLTFKIINDTQRTAEEPYYGFVITDLDELQPNVLPIPFETTTFIKPKSSQGPTQFMTKWGKPEHRYIGTAMITCKNCKSTKRYLLYINNKSPNDGFYVLFKDAEDLRDIMREIIKTQNLSVVPLDRRITFSE